MYYYVKIKIEKKKQMNKIIEGLLSIVKYVVIRLD